MCEYGEGRKTKLDETIEGEGYRIEPADRRLDPKRRT